MTLCLQTVAAVNKANLDEDLKEVDLSISIRSLVTVDKNTKVRLATLKYVGR